MHQLTKFGDVTEHTSSFYITYQKSVACFTQCVVHKFKWTPLLLAMMGKIIFKKNVNQFIKTKESFSACSKGITVTTSAEKINNMHVVWFFRQLSFMQFAS